MSEFKLYRHQELALNYMRANDNFGLFMEQGLGKTICTLVRIGELAFQEKCVNNCLIICPKPVIGSWLRDIPTVNKAYGYELENVLEVTNYEQLLTKSGKINYMSKEWDMIVLDESHYIKNRTTKRTKACLELSLTAKYRNILTGTPIGNGKLENIYSQFTFLQPIKNKQWVHSEIFGTWKDFTTKYCFLNQWYQPYRYKNIDKLQDIINRHSYRVLKKDCLDLPEKLPDQVYDIELKEKKLYSELLKESTIEEFDVLADNGLSRLAKLRQVSSGFVNTPTGMVDLKTEKLKVLKELLEDFDKKLVIFYQFQRSMDNISELLNKLGIKFEYLNGKQKDKSIWKKFQSDESVQVILCQYESASAGIDLFASDTILYYEPTLSSELLEQSRDRIHRIGQSEKCSYIFFITKGTVEEKIYKSLCEYQDFSKRLFEEYIYEYQRSYSK